MDANGNMYMVNDMSIKYGDNGELISWIFDRYPTSDAEALEFAKPRFISNLIDNPDDFKFTNFTNFTVSSFRSSDGALSGDAMTGNDVLKMYDIPTSTIPIFNSAVRFTCFIETEIRFIPVSYTHLTLPTICSV